MTGSSHNNGTAQGVALPEGIELGKYRLIRKIGQGGFGITYLALHTESKEQVVVKENMPTFYAYRDKDTLLVHPLDEGEAKENYLHTLQRFVDEARTLAHLHHPNIVRVLEAFEALGTAYYVMPLVTGKELHKAPPAVVDEAWLAPILRTLLGALDYLHAQNLLHRDIKPGNILLQEDGTPIIIDFGTARALQSNRSATMVGTPGYTPIEQITIHGNRGPWTDLYALGATCYRVITGELPPEANERLAADEDPYRPLAKRAELRHRFSAGLLQSIDTALAVRAKNRWQSAKDWLQHLPPATPQSVAEPSTRSLPVTPLATEPTAPAKHRLLFFGLLALLLATGAYGAYSYIQSSTEKRVREEFAQAETARRAKEEAERLAQEKAAAELARNTELLTRVLAELHAALLQAQPLIPTAAKNVAEGQTPADQAPLQQQINAMLPLAAQLQAYAAALTPEQRSAVCDSLPAEPQALRRYLTELCNHTSAAPSAEDILAILGWNEALSSAQEQKSAADRKAKEEAERLAREEAARKAKEEAQAKLEAMGITDYDKAILQHYDNPEKLKLLITVGADVNKANEYGDTPLHRAAYEGHTEIVKLLLAAPGIDVNKADKDGDTPLYWPARNGRTEVVKLLLAAPGIDVNQATKDGNTPLQMAAYGGHTEVVKLLLAVPGIDVNKAEKDGWTPLRWAAHRGRTECVKLLLAAPGIDVNQATKDGKTPLYEAADGGRLEVIKLLLAAPGIDLHKADKDGKTPLTIAQEKGYVESARMIQAAINGQPIPQHMPRLSKQEAQKRLTAMNVDKKSYGDELVDAADENCTEKLITLLAAGAIVNHEDEYGRTPLYRAAWGGHTECVKLLLAAPDIDVNKADKDGETPLYKAAFDGHTEIVKLLLAAPRIDVNKAKTEDGRTPLYQAVTYGHPEVVKLLLAAPGIDVNKADKDGDTPLYWPAHNGRTEVVKLLLAAPGIDVNQATKHGNTPLQMAAYGGHTEVVKLLLAAPGIEVNKADNSGDTPLRLAAWQGHTECVKLLLDAPGIDVNKAKTELGWTPLYTAAENGHTECVKLLLAAPGIEVNKADKDGETPLYWAVSYGKTEYVKLLLAAPGIDVNKADEDGRPPLYTAVYNGHTEIVKLLLAAPGIEVNKAAEDGKTPLYQAADKGRTEIVKLLLAAPGIDVNKAYKDGQTPLYQAAWDGHTEVVKLLLAAPGIDVNKADKVGWTPLRWAAFDGHTEIVKLLKAAGAKE